MEESVEKYNVDSEISNTVKYYYENFEIRVSSKRITTEWEILEPGVNNISVTLFNVSMNLIINSEAEYRIKTKNTATHTIWIYMDNLDIRTI